jgi:Mg2+ and Co2+ transporter CorA
VLNAHTTRSGDAEAERAKVFWVDLLNPTSTEIAQVAAEYGFEIPSRESLQEIESSSRLRAEGQVLYVSMPLAIQDEAADFAPVPLGFILSPQLLVTIRFSEVHDFAQVRARIEKDPHVRSAAAFCALMEGMVDLKVATDLQSAHDRLRGRHSSDVNREYVRHELSQYAGVRLALGLPLRTGAHCTEYVAADPVV